MQKWSQWCVCAALVIALSGCGGSGSAPPSPPPAVMPTSIDDKAALKNVFEQIAESGSAGSALAGVREGLTKLNDPALIQLLDSLEKAENSDQVKQIAKQIADKL